MIFVYEFMVTQQIIIYISYVISDAYQTVGHALEVIKMRNYYSLSPNAWISCL
jgi:hypothetical protein